MVPARQREGEATGEGFLMRVDRTMYVPGRLGPSGISLVSISDMEQDGVCGVWFWFFVLKDYMYLRM